MYALVLAVQSLFRLNEISGGSIAIDGLNIAHMPLHSLRSKLGLIPQEAELFSGTVRYNIDPFHAVSDDELRRVLHEVGAADMSPCSQCHAHVARRWCIPWVAAPEALALAHIHVRAGRVDPSRLRTVAIVWRRT